MKNLILLFLVFVSTNSYSQSFFDVDQIQKVEIFFPESNWDDVLDSYYTAGSQYRLIGSVIINGIEYDSVGVRYKGNSSYNAAQVKNPLNIKLDYIKGKQNIESRNVIKLSNVFRDPSFVREVISYEIARKYLPSSYSNFTTVYINNTFIGLYVNDESTNLSFAGRHYFKTNDPFFEGEFDSSLSIAGCPIGPPSVLGYLGTDTACYKKYYSIQSNNNMDWFDLVLALDTFNNHPDFIDNAIYIDRLLWMLAFDNVMVNLDAPINPPHNFLLYKDGTKRYNPILWDLNESFGSFNNEVGAGGGTTLTNTELQELSPWFHSTNPNFPILTKSLDSDRHKKMYIAKMKTIFNENINNDLYLERATTLQNMISADVSNDMNKFYSDAEFTDNKTTTVQGRIGLSELMIARKTYLNNQADFLKVSPTISNIINNPEIVLSNSSVTISADITNANYVYLGYRFSPKEKFKKVEMTASGSSYSTVINVETADLQYYIWAENDDAGIFSPERAEYEFHRLGVSGDLVINELQSSNKTTHFDEAVEYDDWVEIYNNSENAINLDGYFLSDNKDTLTKWPIPNQTIEPNAYIIFWTDKDAIQGDNHTNFQLTKNGESLYLVNPSHQVIDQITYTYMPTDKSYSRFPNGRGAFLIKDPTFEVNNSEIDVAIKEKLSVLYKINLSPNPSDKSIFLFSNDERVKNKLITVYDISGKTISTTYWNKTSEQQKIDISKISKGIYFIEIDNNVRLKFIKK